MGGNEKKTVLRFLISSVNVLTSECLRRSGCVVDCGSESDAGLVRPTCRIYVIIISENRCLLLDKGLPQCSPHRSAL